MGGKEGGKYTRIDAKEEEGRGGGVRDGKCGLF